MRLLVAATAAVVPPSGCQTYIPHFIPCTAGCRLAGGSKTLCGKLAQALDSPWDYGINNTYARKLFFVCSWLFFVATFPTLALASNLKHTPLHPSAGGTSSRYIPLKLLAWHTVVVAAAEVPSLGQASFSGRYIGKGPFCCTGSPHTHSLVGLEHKGQAATGERHGNGEAASWHLPRSAAHTALRTANMPMVTAHTAESFLPAQLMRLCSFWGAAYDLLRTVQAISTAPGPHTTTAAVHTLLMQACHGHTCVCKAPCSVVAQEP